jgi:aldehyde:ferredoxin oxidoreductase
MKAALKSSHARLGQPESYDAVAEFHFLVPKTYVTPWEKRQPVSPVATRERFEIMHDEFYRLRGWSPETGTPIDSKLRSLNLGEMAGVINREL